MNWYYQHGIGLDMGYFWRHVIPVLILAVVVCALCLCGTLAVPVSNWGWFIAWGVVYTALYGLAAYRFALNKNERRMLTDKLKHSLSAKR